MKNLSRLLFYLFLFFFSSHVSAQNCLTTLGKSDIEYYQNLLHKRTNNVVQNTMAMNSCFQVPIKIHIVLDQFGNSSTSKTEIQADIASANAHFAPNLCFEQCGEINYIDEPYLHNHIFFQRGEPEEITMSNDHNVDNVINVYFAKSWASWTYFPSEQTDLVLMSTFFHAGNGSTLSHEFGHYFSLFHTHEVATGTEKVTRDTFDPCYNCNVAGDQICDTPADPRLNDVNVDESTCEYIGTEQDFCNEDYVPDPKNIMSYSPSSCRDLFSQEQHARILWSYLNERDLSGTECDEEPGCCSTLAANEFEINCVSGGIEICIPVVACSDITTFTVELFPIDGSTGSVLETATVEEDQPTCIRLTTSANGFDPNALYEIRITTNQDCDDDQTDDRIDEEDLFYTDCTCGENQGIDCCSPITSCEVEVNCTEDGLSLIHI